GEGDGEGNPVRRTISCRDGDPLIAERPDAGADDSLVAYDIGSLEGGRPMFTRLRAARHDDGFTLIELLIVIIILGILAAIVIFAVGGLSGQGATEACKTDGKTIDTAAEAYYAKNGTYPNGPAAAAFTTLQGANILKDKPNATAGTGKYYFTYSGGGATAPTVIGTLSSGGQCYP